MVLAGNGHPSLFIAETTPEVASDGEDEFDDGFDL